MTIRTALLLLCLYGAALAGGSAGTAFALRHTWTITTLTLNVEAHQGKRIETVEFWDGSHLLSKVASAPYRLSVKNDFGCHNHYVRIHYDEEQVAVKTFNLRYCADPPPVKP